MYNVRDGLTCKQAEKLKSHEMKEGWLKYDEGFCNWKDHWKHYWRFYMNIYVSCESFIASVSIEIWSCFFWSGSVSKIWAISSLTLWEQGYKYGHQGRGGGVKCPTLESARMKHVRSQNRGSRVCPVHLDYFQLPDMCISRVFTWF